MTTRGCDSGESPATSFTELLRRSIRHGDEKGVKKKCGMLADRQKAAGSDQDCVQRRAGSDRDTYPYTNTGIKI